MFSLGCQECLVLGNSAVTAGVLFLCVWIHLVVVLCRNSSAAGSGGLAVRHAGDLKWTALKFELWKALANKGHCYFLCRTSRSVPKIPESHFACWKMVWKRDIRRPRQLHTTQNVTVNSEPGDLLLVSTTVRGFFISAVSGKRFRQNNYNRSRCTVELQTDWQVCLRSGRSLDM